MAKKVKKRNKIPKKKVTIFVIICVCIILLAITAFLIVFIKGYLLGGLNRNKITKDANSLGIDSSMVNKSSDTKIVNIALFGVDSRKDTFTGLSDAIMVATIDKKSGYVKLTSIARDSQVAIDGHGNANKINAAYSYGGPELAIKTLNQNFGLDIKDYVTINISGLAKAIDVAGGVDIEINEAEKNMANGIMDELTPKEKKIAKSGMVHLNGTQATAYCRIRKIDTDLVRISRQKKVLEILFNKAKTLSPTKMAETIHTMMPMVETSLKDTQIIDLASILTNKNVQLVNMKFPNSKSNYKSGEANGWNIVFDLKVAKQQINDFIYNDVRIPD